MTDEQLDDLWRNDRPTVKDALSAVGDDPELAAASSTSRPT
jgi:hypothetical protein